MGLDGRDYAREGFSSDRGGWSSSTGSAGIREWEVWKKLIAVNVIVFLLQIFFTRTAGPADFQRLNAEAGMSTISRFDEMDEFAETDDLESLEEFESRFIRDRMIGSKTSIVQEWCELDSKKVLSGQIWRPFTAGFLHNRFGVWHLLFNMLFLFWFGSRLEMRFGSAEFTAFYFASLLVSSLAYIGLDLYTQSLIPAIGASGAIWGVVALYAMLYPYEQIRIYFLFPVQIWLLALIYFIYDLHPVLLALSGENYFSGVGHAAHVGGAVFGFLYFKNGWRLMPLIDYIRGIQKPFANSQSRNYQSQNYPSNVRSDGPETIKLPGRFKRLHSEDEQRLDEILDKLSAQGQSSLTDEEQAFLEEASKKLKDA